MTKDPADFSLDDLMRRARRTQVLLRLFMGVLVAIFILVLVWLIPAAIRFPAASVPALAFALIGYFQARRHGAREIDAGRGHRDMPPLQARAIIWGLVGGALSYAVLAALGVGVPNTSASLAWRVVGGVTFGAGAGIAAGFLVSMAGLLVYGIALAKRAA